MRRQTIVCHFLSIVFFLVIFLFFSSDIYAGVVINEFLADPSEDENEEFIELFNTGDSSEDISGWKLDDKSTVGSPYIIASGSSISARGFLVFERATTKIALNNSDGDIVQLFSKLGSLVDSYTYGSTKEGVSIGRSQDGTGEFIDCISVTRGGSNNCYLPTTTPTHSPTQTPTETPTHTCTPKPTNTATPTLTNTPTINQSITITSTIEEDEREQDVGSSNEENNEVAEVLGAEATQSSMINPQLSLRTFIIAFAFVGGGFGLLSLIFTLQKMRMK